MHKKILLGAGAALLTLALTSCGSTAPTTTPTTQGTASNGTVQAPATTSASASTPTQASSAPVTKAAGLSTAAAQEGAADIVADFYNRSFKLPAKNITAVQALNKNYKSYTKAEYVTKIEKLMPAFKDIHHGGVSTANLAGFEYAYSSIILGVADALQQQGTDSFMFVVDPSQITLTENNTVGAVPGGAVSITYQGKTTPNTSSNSTFYTIYDNGKWYIDPTRSS